MKINFASIFPHLYIRTKRGGDVPFTPKATQQKVIDEVERQYSAGTGVRIICLKARQLGQSTLGEAMGFAWVLTHPNQNAAVIAHNTRSTEHLFQMTKHFYDALTPAIRASYPHKYATRRELVLFHPEGGESRMHIMVAESVQGGRGLTLQFIHACLAEGSPVLLADGRSKPIEQVQIGDQVLTHQGNQAWVQAVTSWPGGPTVKITPWLGKAVELTADHKVWTREGWKAAGDLTRSDWVSLPIRPIRSVHTVLAPVVRDRPRGGGPIRPKGETLPLPLNAATGFSIGYYLAEGSIQFNQVGNPGAVSFTHHHDETAYAERALKPLDPWVTSVRVDRRQFALTEVHTAYGAALCEMLEREFGHGAANKRIPDWVFDAGEEFIGGLIAGYLAGDGSKTSQVTQGYGIPNISATTVSSSLAFQMRDLVASLGIGVGSISVRKAGVVGGRNNAEAWIATWSGRAARILRGLVGLEAAPTDGRRWIEKSVCEDTTIWFKIRNIELGYAERVWDIAVDHEDHSFRTAWMSVSNSEVAQWPEPEETMISLGDSMPVGHPSMFFIESTAYGQGGWFHDQWHAAVAGDSDYVPIFLPWYEEPEYALEGQGRKLGKLAEDEKDLIHRGVTKDQLAWRRWKIRNVCGGDLRRFWRENPACVVGQTRVGTDVGLLRIEEADEAAAGTLGAIRATHQQPESPVFTMRTKLGYELTGTFDHPIFTTLGLLVPLQCSLGQRVRLQPPRLAAQLHEMKWWANGIDHTVTITPDWGRLLGLFMADGSIGRGATRDREAGNITFSCDARDQDVVDEIQRLLKSVLGLKSSTRLTGANKGCAEVRAYSLEAVRLLRRVGIVRENSSGRPLRRVCVPEVVWRSPPEVVKGFLSGYFEGDGFSAYRTPRVSVACKHESMLKDVQLLLLAFGITARRPSPRKARNGFGRDYIARSLELRGEEAVAFQERIGFISGRKLARMVQPAGPRGRRRLLMVLEDEVESVELVGTAVTYDFTIEGGEAFDANGILTHNTPEEAFISSGMPAFSPDSLRACYDPRSAREGYIDEAVAGGAHFVQSSPSSLRAFKAPATGCEYYVGARTTPYTLGPCVAQVLNRRTCEQVAVYEGSCDPIAFARELLKIGKFYNEAILAPDVEELGYGVVDYIARSGYPRIFMHRLGDRIPGSSMSSTVLGWSSTFKRQGWSFSALMDMLGTGRITIHDEPTYDALRAAQIHEQSTGRTWEYSDPDGSGRVSDLVVALGIACVGIEVEPLPTRDPMGEFTGRTGPIRLMAPPPPWEEEPKEDFSDEWIAGIL